MNPKRSLRTRAPAVPIAPGIGPRPAWPRLAVGAALALGGLLCLGGVLMAGGR
ncbi:MAG TPA: hypothetical protein VIC57_17820 [Candidatus Dormibacteraeota bacterium]|jgi:hypothetical protein